MLWIAVLFSMSSRAKSYWQLESYWHARGSVWYGMSGMLGVIAASGMQYFNS